MKDDPEAWFAGQPDLDPARVVFNDRNATTTMARRYGGAARGERCRVSVSFGHV